MTNNLAGNSQAQKQNNSIQNGSRVLPVIVDIETPRDDEQEDVGENIIARDNKKQHPKKAAVVMPNSDIANKENSLTCYHCDFQDMKAVMAVLIVSCACISPILLIMYICGRIAFIDWGN
mmetsp:Transcript_8165/g.11773  ORF Transcript_8165/g.11773 Transcript_8165/m.11773 type:complete len:120 (+) Transcript_8165:209-568(+)